MSAQLGTRLNAARTGKGLSLQAVSEPAKVSTAYLHKLEAGRVTSPNPRVLHRLADVLDASYRELMELTGYLVPVSEGREEAAGDAPQPATSGEPSGPTGSPTNDELLRQVQAVRAELVGVRERQDELARALERLPDRVARRLEYQEGSRP